MNLGEFIEIMNESMEEIDRYMFEEDETQQETKSPYFDLGVTLSKVQAYDFDEQEEKII